MLFDNKRWNFNPVVFNLKNARQILIDRGWCRDCHSDNNGRVCIIIAIQRAMGYSHAEYLRGAGDQERERLRRAIGCDDLIEWAEAPGRTFDEVLAGFERAIGS